MYTLECLSSQGKNIRIKSSGGPVVIGRSPETGIKDLRLSKSISKSGRVSTREDSESLTWDRTGVSSRAKCHPWATQQSLDPTTLLSCWKANTSTALQFHQIFNKHCKKLMIVVLPDPFLGQAKWQNDFRAELVAVLHSLSYKHVAVARTK